MKQIIDTMKSLSDEIRLRIINLLYEQDLHVCEIVECLSLPQSTVSRHLSILKNANIVEDTKQGQWVMYKLLKGNNDRSFVQCLIIHELRTDLLFQKDIETLKQILIKEGGCKK